MSEGGCTISEKVAVDSDGNEICVVDTDSSIANSSIWSSESDISYESSEFKDPFEGIFYRTHASESKLSISFVSSVFLKHSRTRYTQTTPAALILMRPVLFQNVQPIYMVLNAPLD